MAVNPKRISSYTNFFFECILLVVIPQECFGFVDFIDQKKKYLSTACIEQDSLCCCSRSF